MQWLLSGRSEKEGGREEQGTVSVFLGWEGSRERFTHHCKVTRRSRRTGASTDRAWDAEQGPLIVAGQAGELSRKGPVRWARILLC